MTHDEAIQKVLSEVERQHRLVLRPYPTAEVKVSVTDAIAMHVKDDKGHDFVIVTKTLAIGAL